MLSHKSHLDFFASFCKFQPNDVEEEKPYHPIFSTVDDVSTICFKIENQQFFKIFPTSQNILLFEGDLYSGVTVRKTLIDLN